MKAVEVLKQITDLLGIQLSTNGGDVYGKLADGGVVSTNAFTNGNVVITQGGGALADGEYTITVETENGSAEYALRIEGGVIAGFDLLPKKAEQKMSQEVETVAETTETPQVEEVKLAIEDVVAALEARIKALEDYVKADEAEDVAEGEAPMTEMVAEQKMSASKKFTGAPVEEAKMKPIVNNKASNTIDRVWEKMANY